MKRRLLPVLAILACGAIGGAPAVRDGDIVFQVSRSSQSLAIQRATGSRYSHMGVVLYQGGKPYVLEAVSTVRSTPLDRWIARGSGEHYVVKRLENAERVLTPEAVRKLRRTSRQFLGRPYDLMFEWSDSRIYCSELVWKLYDRALGIRIGELQRLETFHLADPVVRAKMRERYGERVPRQEPVISPAAMFRSPLLATVAER